MRWNSRISHAKQTIMDRAPAGIRLLRIGTSQKRRGEPEIRELHRLVTPGTVAIDVGAHFGEYSYVLAKLVGKRGRVICIEPVAEDAAALAKGARQLRLPIDLINCALSSKNGYAELYIPSSEGDLSTALSSLRHVQLSDHSDSRTVQVKRLDDITHGITQPISLVKIDVEGHEVDVLAGAEATLTNYRPNLIVEIEKRHNSMSIEDVFQLIMDRGFRGEFIDDTGVVRPLSEFDVTRHQDQHLGNVDSRHYINNFIFLPN
jgi:FkbM family methyltransferase